MYIFSHYIHRKKKATKYVNTVYNFLPLYYPIIIIIIIIIITIAPFVRKKKTTFFFWWVYDEVAR